MGQIRRFLLAGRLRQDRHLVFFTDQHLIVRFDSTQQRLTESRPQQRHHFFGSFLSLDIAVLNLRSGIVGKLIMQLPCKLNGFDLHFGVGDLTFAAQLT
ncbi:hypothetical protein D3C80_1698710 [compost metagenome]